MPASRDPRVAQYLASLDADTATDATALDAMFQRISGHQPTLWNAGTLGYGTYHYEYATGRSGDGHVIGFYPRRGRTTVYLMHGTARQAALLGSLGPHSLTGYCVYIKKLSDVDRGVLEQIVRDSFENISLLAAAGPIREILWKAEG